jgi:hypothetical protein
MIPALCRRGFGHGSGVLSPDGRIFVVNIPKNASSYVLDWAYHHGWRANMADHVTQVSEMIVLLRDPIERWISGIAQYVNTYILSVHGPNGPVFPGDLITEHDYVMSVDTFCGQYTDATERVIIDNAARLDDHVWPQCEIIQDVLPAVPRRYFWVDPDLDYHLGQYLGWNKISGLSRNASSDNSNIQQLQQFFQQRLTQRPELRARLTKQYQNDYDLIDRVIHA